VFGFDFIKHHTPQQLTHVLGGAAEVIRDDDVLRRTWWCYGLHTRGDTWIG
jgi:hypothetical protein